ncbi:hypothetical protein [Bradyrhizobium ottawaense]
MMSSSVFAGSHCQRRFFVEVPVVPAPLTRRAISLQHELSGLRKKLPNFPETEPRPALRVNRRLLLGGFRDEQAFILGNDRCRRHRDFGIRAIISEHVELHSVRNAAKGLHGDAVLSDVDTLEFIGLGSDHSLEQLGSEPVAIIDQPDRW